MKEPRDASTMETSKTDPPQALDQATVASNAALSAENSASRALGVLEEVRELLRDMRDEHASLHRRVTVLESTAVASQRRSPPAAQPGLGVPGLGLAAKRATGATGGSPVPPQARRPGFGRRRNGSTEETPP